MEACAYLWECRQSVGVTCGSRRELSLKGA